MHSQKWIFQLNVTAGAHPQIDIRLGHAQDIKKGFAQS